MAKYTGKTVRVDVPAEQISEKFSDLTKLNQYTDRLPKEQLEKLGEMRFEKEAIVLKNPAIGEMAFKVAERNPSHVLFKADGMIPLSIDVKLKAADAQGSSTDMTTLLDIEIPMMLRPLIGNKLQQVADMFGDMIAKLVQHT